MRGHLVWNWYAAPEVFVAHRLDHFLLAIIIDDTKGNSTTETVWDDTDVAKLDTIANTQLHRNVDVLILAADKEGKSRVRPTPPPKHASSMLRHLYLPTVARVREDILRHPFDDLWLRFRKTGGSGCSEHTLHSDPFGNFRQYCEEACRICRPGTERVARCSN
jgi:hypothetical protein